PQILQRGIGAKVTHQGKGISRTSARLKRQAKKSQSHQGQEGLPSIIPHGRLQSKKKRLV
ncbi:hypothetical protein, partial [Actinobacillus pleuropneumoniae]|uniref:hypothetical protein n=1 Tax=Actinobacillus pleuropneumoniae TaxID=715 RepID=UPI00227C7918